MFHKGEEQQILQAYKRIWGISEVTETEIVCQFNMGYYKGSGAALAFYKQYETAMKIANRTQAIVEQYHPRLYGKVGAKMFPALGEKYREMEEREKAKISDPEQIKWDELPEPVLAGQMTLDDNYDEVICEYDEGSDKHDR